MPRNYRATVVCVLHIATDAQNRSPDGTNAGAGLHVSVLGAFGFSAADGSHPSLSGGSQRLLALLALHGESVTRGAAAGLLWPGASGDHASSSLRSALSRLGSTTRIAVSATDADLCLADNVVVDIRASQDLARQLLTPCGADRVGQISATAISALSQDLLPDWYDDWVIPEADEWRRLRRSALESLSEHLASVGRFAHAIGAALAAVHVEPLRESANAALIRVHLAEGNQADALREFRRYRALLQREIGVEPTADLFDLVGVAPSASRRGSDSRADATKWASVPAARRHR